MASLAASQVTRLRTWTEGSVTGKERKCWRVSIATSSSPGQGGTTNTIPASVFEMSVIEESSAAILADGTLIPTSPSSTGAALYLYDLTNATDANRADPADFISTTFVVTVKGY